LKTSHNAACLALFLLISSHVCAAEESKADRLLDLEWRILQNNADVREVLAAPPEATGQACWDQNIGKEVLFTEWLVDEFDTLPDARDRMNAQKGAANELLDLAAAWSARGCPFNARYTYLYQILLIKTYVPRCAVRWT